MNFQCRGVLQLWMIVGQGPIVLAIGAVGVVWTFFSLVYLFSFLSPSLWETARYRLKYCLKGPLNPKTTTTTNSKNTSLEEKYQTRKTLGSAIFQCLKSIPRKDYENAFKNWIKRLKLCLSHGGEYFKGSR